MIQKTQELALDRGSVPRLLIKYATPSIISMMAASLYNIVDSMFIGRGVGAYAISGFALTLPVMNLAAAFGAMVGVGASSMVAVRLGQRDTQTATHALGNALVLNTVIGLLFTLAGLLFLDPILFFFGASENTVGYAREYMQIILAGNVITHIYHGLNDNLRASGYPRKAMTATLLAIGLNCLLDPLFIFGFRWGLRGAALATVLAQVVALVYVFSHYTRPTSTLHFVKGCFQVKWRLVKGILSVGLSPFLLNACNCMIVIIINKTFFHYGGDLAIGAYGIANRVVFLFVMLALGLSQGMQPLVGFNYGARRYDRVIQFYKLTVGCALGVTGFAFLCCQLFTPQIVGIFTDHAELASFAIEGLKIDTAAFFIVGLPMVSSGFFQAIRKPGKAIFLSLTRQLLFLIPLLLILPRFYGTRGVWLSLPLSDVISTLAAGVLIFLQLRSFRRYMNEKPDLAQ